MAIKQTACEYCSSQDDFVKEFICDTEADVATLPSCCAKSTAMVADTGNVYIVNASGQWVLFGGEA